MRVGVAGLGLIGGSLLQGLAAAGVETAGLDPHPGGAVRAGFQVFEDVGELARACLVVIVCAPPDATAAVVTEALAANEDVVVADTCSVKDPIVRAVAAEAGSPVVGGERSIAAEARSPIVGHERGVAAEPRSPAVGRERFVPAHPLAGAAATGWESAEPALLRDAVWAVCPPRPDAGLEAVCALSEALDPLGARFVACTPEEHDDAVARTSHVPHVVAQALARLPAGDPLAAALSGGAYRDMTRTAAAGAELWRSILLANRRSTLAALDALRDDLADLARALTVGDDDALATAWREGAAGREQAEARRWTKPAWRRRTVSGWEELIELGRAGIAVRRLRAADGVVELDAGG